MTIADIAQRLAAAYVDVEEAEAKLDEAKKKRTALQREAADELTEAEIKNLKIETPNGTRTVYLHRSILANIEKSDEAFEALRQTSGDYLIKETVNANSFRSWFKEQIPEDADATAEPLDVAEIPDDLKAFVKAHEKIEARIKKG
jgi:hypothetical protein